MNIVDVTDRTEERRIRLLELRRKFGIVDSAGIMMEVVDNNMMRKTVEVKKGLPCTIGVGSDRYAHSVEGVSKNGKRIMTSDGMVWSKRKNGRFVPVGSKIYGSGYGLRLGIAEDYRDPSF